MSYVNIDFTLIRSHKNYHIEPMAAKQRAAVLMSFCTFYDWMDQKVELWSFDWVLNDSIAKCRVWTENMLEFEGYVSTLTEH